MSRDLTIETALADPMIRAVMQADGVEPKAFERFLRTIAAETAPGPRAMAERLGQAAIAASRTGTALRGFCCA